ncbi:hypothetical protein DL897_10780 [Thermoflavimicrobium daqui]|uniref:Uncharacterized protein n=1 Tax=Thermoflavimicrobium daqui TaxID=2137476 RepID=A0A364K4E2_9BACL|nr:hypothetical protein DL897_10780 [Thermoflavimicrobium daqui]
MFISTVVFIRNNMKIPNKRKGAIYFFESSWKKKYTDRGIRKILHKYSNQAGMVHKVQRN